MAKVTRQDERHSSATSRMAEILRENREGRRVGVFSICSANRYVLEAGMRQAARNESLLLIESTSNQVNQFGGYTGQTPADFVEFVSAIAREQNFPEDQVVLGGDHLGPHPWKSEPAASAMKKGCALVRDYVRAGYTKIHLDASMHCADDYAERPLSDEIVGARAAMLCEAAENAREGLADDWPAPVYVVGTEVPIPGGGRADTEPPEVTKTEDLERTLKLTRKAFTRRGLEAAWKQVIAVVVQPGIEFRDATVFPYELSKTERLASFCVQGWTGVYEAHSTDYQAAKALQQMVRDHFGILKVGPWLTFAFREAIFALAQMEEEWLGGRPGMLLSKVREALEQAMVRIPAHWQGHYHGDENALRFARKYSYSDRSRYYWPQRDVGVSVQQLLSNLAANPAPTSLLSQYLPVQCEQVRSGELANHPLDLIRSKITQVLDIYAGACGVHGGAGC